MQWVIKVGSFDVDRAHRTFVISAPHQLIQSRNNHATHTALSLRASAALCLGVCVTQTKHVRKSRRSMCINIRVYYNRASVNRSRRTSGAGLFEREREEKAGSQQTKRRVARYVTKWPVRHLHIVPGRLGGWAPRLIRAGSHLAMFSPWPSAGVRKTTCAVISPLLGALLTNH